VTPATCTQSTKPTGNSSTTGRQDRTGPVHEPLSPFPRARVSTLVAEAVIMTWASPGDCWSISLVSLERGA
jgi:hypothetical protein